MVRGNCLCGAVSFEIMGEIPPANACHCSQCRKQSGHYWASIDIPETSLKLTSADTLRWFQSSEKVRRGFCGTCGSFLFWDPATKPEIAVATGSLEAPTGVRLAGHIFTANKGDYYEISDGLPQNPQ